MMQTGRTLAWRHAAAMTIWLMLFALMIAILLRPPGSPQPHAAQQPVVPPVTSRGDLHDEEMRNIELFQAASPSTVYITIHRRVLDPRSRTVTEIPRGSGSGFIWDERGHIVTNYHVVQNVSEADVVLHDQSTHRALVIGISPAHDLAVLRMEEDGQGFAPLPLGTSHDLRVGQKVLAIGNPFGLDQTLTTGVVSALNRRIMGIGDRPIDDVIQTDAAINPGNSGGPLLDSAGRLIGINTAIVSPSGAYAGLGFAVPVDTVRRVVPQLIATGEYRPARLGVGVNEQIERSILPRLNARGALILSVEEDSPADRAGLQPTLVAADGSVNIGDIIQRIDNQPINSASDLLLALDRKEPGDRVALGILRNGRIRTVRVELE